MVMANCKLIAEIRIYEANPLAELVNNVPPLYTICMY